MPNARAGHSAFASNTEMTDRKASIHPCDEVEHNDCNCNIANLINFADEGWQHSNLGFAGSAECGLHAWAG